MRKMIIIGGLILAIALAGTSYGVPPGQPFQELLDLINGLAARVTTLEASGGGGATRVVLSGTIDFGSEADVVREIVGSDGRKRVSHFRLFSIPDLTTADPPDVTLFRRPRTELIGGQVISGFVTADVGNLPDPPRLDATLIAIEEGKILLRFKFEIFNLDNTVEVRYGLDGPGGTGEFRLVLVR